MSEILNSNIPKDLVERICEAVEAFKYALDAHAFERLQQRKIRPNEIRHIVLFGTAIEYDHAGTRDRPFPGILFSGMTTDGRPLHVKVDERIQARTKFKHFVVTAYEPDPELWDDNFRLRR